MRAIRVATAVLLGAGALALAAPPAAHGQEDITPFGFAVEPSTIAAGGRVTLRVERDGRGCRGPARVTSGVFDAVTVPAYTSTATAVVDRDARPGAVYQVTFTCDGASGSTGLTIAGGAPEPTRRPVPPHGVHAGGGGTVAGFDLRELGLGALLVAGSAGTAYHLSRRRESP